jgi:hypothetical protein
MRHLLLLSVCGLVLSAGINAQDIGFVEDFALAEDRAKALKQLIPGTEDYYYYHCLHHQHTGAFDKIDELVKLWIERHGRTARVEEILNRQAVLTYEKDPKKSLDFIRWRLNLQFNHEKDVLDAKPNLPTRLDPVAVSLEKFTQEALQRYPASLQGFKNTALDRLANQPLSGERRRELLNRLIRPDVPNLVQLVIDDLKFQYSSGFGSLAAHRQMTQAQLDELLKAMPDLLNEVQYVNTYLLKLQPAAGVDLNHDLKEREAYLDRVWTFAQKLAPAHNSLKAHVVFNRLVYDRSQGVYDKNRFLEYLKLPRNTGCVNPEYLKRPECRDHLVNLSETFENWSRLAVIGSDDEVVRDYLMHFFAREDSYTPYVEYLRDDYVKPLFAETKIVNGIGDMELWYSMLNDPARYQVLKDRIDIDFAHTNKGFFKAADAVSLDVDVKNVKTLLVKVFEINALNYYQQYKREVDSSINLDGLVANEEKTYTYEEPPLRRMRRHFDFPLLKKPGVYVIEFIGNGMSSRALICKGQLRFVERTGTAGHIFNIMDDQNKAVVNAKLWLDGHEYSADKDGAIHVPYSTRPGLQSVVLIQDQFASLSQFHHFGETYTLNAGFYVDRESLLKRRSAKLLIRPVLRINDIQATVALLENVALEIQSTNRDGVSSTRKVTDFKLSDNKEVVYDFHVPENLAEIRFMLSGQVQSLTEAKKLDVSTRKTFSLNLIDTTEKIQSLLLERTAAGYELLLLGKSGEPRADQPVVLQASHRDFIFPLSTSLQTNETGRIVLGALPGIVHLSGGLTDGQTYDWHITTDDHSYPSTTNAKAGEVLRIPYMGSEKQPTRAAFALIERRPKDEVATRDWFENLSLADGFVELKNLPAGDFELFLKEADQSIKIHIADGEERHGYVLAAHRQLEIRNADPLQIASIDSGADAIKIQLKNVGANARVHVVATRLLPAFSLDNELGHNVSLEPEIVTITDPDAAYLTGRNIGDEYRYILERRYAAKYPGNMLQRPSLLLNPFSLTPTQIGAEFGAGGGSFGSRGGGGRKLMVKRHGGSAATESNTTRVANLDFLPEGSVMLANLIADKDGLITIARKDLGGRQHVRVIAIDDSSSAYREVALPATPWAPLDLRLDNGLDPTKHFTEQKQITTRTAGQPLNIDDVGVSNVEPYDNLQRLFTLYGTINHCAALDEFRFILDWPKMKIEEKRAKYSKYACHELNFFLSRKDADFFKTVILPYLQNKKDKTFLDRYLVNEDLSQYLKPYAHARLNVLEQILLSERLREVRENTARDVKDRFDLLPPDVERFNFLFKTALQGSALELDDAAGRGGVIRDRSKTAEAAAKPAMEGLQNAFAAPPAPAKITDHSEVVEIPPTDPTSKRAEKDDALADDDAAADKKEELAKDLETRAEVARFYQTLKTTEELAENNYYKLPITQQTHELVTPNAFWKDYAAHVAAGNPPPFLSANAAEASRSFTEIMLALAVLDIPFEAGNHESDLKGSKLTFNAKSPLIAFHKEIKECEPGEKSPILVSQNFYRADDRYRFENNERFDKYVTDEFLVFTVYGCQIVLTNPTSSPQKLDLMLQIPRGALPALNGFYTKGHYLQMAPYSTATVDYGFYFPKEGEFVHYPAHVARNGKLVTFAPAATLKVVRKLTRIDTESWDYVSQFGTPEQVLAYMKANNLHRINLDRIAWRMKDAGYFKSVLGLLASRHLYNHTLWSYGIYHDLPDASREFLTKDETFVSLCGRWLTSKLLDVEPVSRHLYQHLEYSPLVNARAHRLGKERKILNDRFYAQYDGLLQVLKYKPVLDDEDRLTVSYYMLLQDRIEEALAFFAKVDAAKISERLQYDYTRAYVDFYSDAHNQARQIAQSYKDHPVDRWRNRFVDVLNQLDEAEGKAAQIADKEDREHAMGKLTADAPSFDFKIEGQKAMLTFQNLTACEVNYYPMDIELLFSGNPFVREVSGQFGFVRPVKTEIVKLPENGRSHSFELPVAFRTSNVMVEITAGGMRKSQAYYANSLALQVIENYGQVKVTTAKDATPTPKVYVKVYARMKNGAVQFYKDGYTDLRGRFDYASLSTNDLDNVDRFSVLVMSDTDGAVIREAQPPKR